MENILAGRVEKAENRKKLVEFFTAFLVTVGTAMGQIVDIRGGFGCDGTVESVRRSRAKNALCGERKWLPVLQEIHHDAGVQQSSHTAFSRSSRASSKVMVSGTLPNRASTVSNLF